MSKNQEMVTLTRRVLERNPDGTIKVSYKEVKIGKAIYRVTSVFKGEVDFKEAIERVIIRNAVYDIRKG